MGKKLLASVVAIAMVAVILAPRAGGADNGDDRHADLSAELQPCCGAGMPKAKGQIHRQVGIAQGIIVKEKFTAKISFPVDWRNYQTYLAETENAEVLMTFAGDAGPYAECLLPFWKVTYDLDWDDAELKIKAIFRIAFDARLKKGQWVQKKSKYGGWCDVDLAQAGVQSQIPEIGEGDVVYVALNGVPILAGLVELED